MSSQPNERIFKIHQKIRETIRKRLPELEDFLISIAIESYKDIISEEPEEDPFSFLKTEQIVQARLSQDKDIFDENDHKTDNDNEDGREVSVITRQFNQKTYYTFVDDEDNELCGVHERVVNDDHESEVGDLVGYVDTEDRFWEAKKKNGTIEEYECDGMIIPALKNSTMRYPDLVSLRKNR